jgi:dTDP-glucose 4,6-dehydratase
MGKILVLGSNSPSGASFCAHALDLGYEVIATSRSPEKPDAFLPYRWNGRTGLTFHRIDLNKDMAALKSLMLLHRPRHVLNFASQSMVAQSWEKPVHWMRTNVVAVVELLELLRSMDFLERYIHFSTPEVYGTTDDWVREHRHYAPSTPYASSRAAGDMNVALWAATYGLPAVITRAANVYGEGQQLYRIIPRALLCAFTGQKLPLQGGGLSERSFIHFDDVSRAMMLLIEQGRPGQDYHVSPRSSIRIRDLVRLIADIADVTFDDLVDMAPDRLGKDQSYRLDPARMNEEFGWTPEISLDDGLRRCAAWCRAHLDLFKTLPQVYHHSP